MLGNTPRKKQFSYTSLKSLKKDEERPLREKMKFSSYSSQERKSNKKKMVFYFILLLLILTVIFFYGFKSVRVVNLKINENELEKVNG